MTAEPNTPCLTLYPLSILSWSHLDLYQPHEAGAMEKVRIRDLRSLVQTEQDTGRWRFRRRREALLKSVFQGLTHSLIPTLPKIQADCDLCTRTMASQVLPVVNNPPANAEDMRHSGLIPGLGRSPGEGHGNPLQYACLENPYGQRSLASYRPWGHKESDMTERTHIHTSAHLTNEKNEPSLGSILRFLDSKIHVLDTTRREGNRSQDYWHLWYNMLSK